MRFYAAMMIVTAIALTSVDDMSRNGIDNSYDVFNLMVLSALWPVTFFFSFAEADFDDGA